MTVIVPHLDFKNPDYRPIWQSRIEALNRIRTKPACIPALKIFYRNNPIQCIVDWGQTFDPRRADQGEPVSVPFIPFPKQVEWMEWVLASWALRRPGVTPKSRESGVSWMAIALSCVLCNFRDNVAIGFGSSKLELVDKLGDPKSLFWKAREFMAMLPPELTDNWQRSYAPEKLIKFPHTGSTMAGEGGDDIGRGGRTALYWVDEAASLERPTLADQSLLSNTNCRMDISTAKGSGNPFHRKVTTWPSERVFVFSWRDDPRKDEAWYQKQKDESDPVTIAQEVDIDFSASVEGVLIPSDWVQAAVDAHIKLRIKPTDAKRGALDVADEGVDLNAFAVMQGILLTHVEEWSGKGSDIFSTVQRAFSISDTHDLAGFSYDADGLGAGVRGDARVVNDGRERKLSVEAFRGSAAVHDPEREDVKGRKNEDFFMNLKAQSWWRLRKRFETTFRAVTGASVETAQDYDPDAIISLDSRMPLLTKLCGELSQPTYSISIAGKVVVDKKPDGTRSPNLADAVMIVGGCPMRRPIVINPNTLRSIREMGLGRRRRLA